MVPASPTHPSNRTNPIGVGGNGDWNFDRNVVIIPVILLYALMCALVLYSLIRCALRCSQRLPFETTEATTTQLAMTGLNKCDLRRIPVAIYRSNTNISTTECPICLVEFIEGEKVRALPSCNHIFHVRCIDIWLSSHPSCPICRHSLLDRSVATICIDIGELPQEMDGSPSIIEELDEIEQTILAGPSHTTDFSQSPATVLQNERISLIPNPRTKSKVRDKRKRNKFEDPRQRGHT
ncbi:hypothetical protein IEQ34_019056 [Dendrobium chrysotoxum]|uniref:RING-type domain-containing protein n=1 Tax=Dendrobium chrysotoxum TaxID=161865 RepID=A0AAV7G8D3_DENCH|nr:hypothetical protein IEQ34_019056 [Dendrobium chrysotoxum]